MKTSPYRRKHRRRAFRRLFWLLVLALATLLLLLWPRRVTLDGLNSPHAILLRADSGEVLAEKDADSTIYPASMTKMMTALLAIEANPDLDTPVTLPEEIFPALQAQNASLAGFQAGETATVRDLLYGAMLPSGAECCEALAREVSGSEEAFAARMNQKAAELGMTGTHFCNPTGLHDPEHVSTVRDMARLTEAALQNETFRKLFTTERYTVPATNCHPQGFTMHSTLLSQLDGTELHRGRILGGKTGYTGEAGLCLASLAEVKGREYILVTAGAGGDHSTAPYHIEDAVTVYRRVSRGSRTGERMRSLFLCPALWYNGTKPFTEQENHHAQGFTGRSLRPHRFYPHRAPACPGRGVFVCLRGLRRLLPGAGGYRAVGL